MAEGALRDGAEISGAFRVTTRPSARVVTGDWHIVRQGDRLSLEAVPSGGWTTDDAPRMSRFLFRVVAMFRDRPTTYRWTTTLHRPESGESVESSVPIESTWKRIGGRFPDALLQSGFSG